MIMDVVVFLEILLVSSTMLPRLSQSLLGILEGHATALRNISGIPELSYQDYFSESPEHGDELCYTGLIPPYASLFSNPQTWSAEVYFRLAVWKPASHFSHSKSDSNTRICQDSSLRDTLETSVKETAGSRLGQDKSQGLD